MAIFLFCFLSIYLQEFVEFIWCLEMLHIVRMGRPLKSKVLGTYLTGFHFSLQLEVHLKLALLSCQLNGEEGRAHEWNLSLTGKRRVEQEYLRCSVFMWYASTQLSRVFSRGETWIMIITLNYHSLWHCLSPSKNSYNFR